MTREPILSNNPVPEEDDPNLRPSRMADMVGQRDVIARLQIAIEAARKRSDVLGHVLFDGPPGLGKTTFAHCIPLEMDVPVDFLSGPSLKAPKDLVPSLTNLQAKQVLFIDEIHRIPKSVEEYLYTAMEDFRIDLILGEGINARTHNMKLQPFTLIGATTRAGMLTGPLRDRFQIREHLEFYNDEDLTEIVRRNASKLNIAISDDAASEVAASVSSFKEMLEPAADPDDVVLDFYYSRVYDQSGLEAINSMAEKYESLGKRLHLTHLSPECRTLLKKGGDLVEINISEDPQYHVATDRLAWRSTSDVTDPKQIEA